MAMTTATDPDKKISLAEAFLQDFPASDFKSGAYLAEMQAYYQQSKTDQAVESAKKVLDLDPDNILALRFLSYAFPFLYKPDQADAISALSRAASDAHHGLDVLQKLQKPATTNEEDFQQGVKQVRSVFNECIGFVALKRRDFPSAITALEAAVADQPGDVY